MMRVLHVINGLEVGGAEKLLVESLPFFSSHIDIDVVLLSKSESILKDVLKKSDFRGKVLELTDTSVYNPRLIFALRKVISNYDVVHVHLFPALYWVVLASLLIRKTIKLVYTEHSTNNKRRKNFILKYIDRFIYSKISRIVTISDDVDFELRKHLQIESSNKIIKIENGINLEKINTALPYPKSMFFTNKDVLLMQVSSFRYPKDQKTLIDSLCLLPVKYKLLLVGEGPLMNDIQSYVKEMDLSSRVKFLGIRNDIPELLKTVDVVILSSAYEGLSLSSIEGMCSGNPFIASDVKGLSKIVKGYGLVFEHKNFKELAERIFESVEVKELRERVIRACKIRAAQFDIKKMVSNYINLYKKI